MSGILSPKELSLISSAADDALMAEERKEREKKAKQMKELQEAFMSQELHPEVRDRVNQAVRRAAEQGHTQLQVMTFPASYCNDHGRRINTLDPAWPESLEGFAKRAYEFYDREMRPLGYKLHCEIISFPGGMPGDVGMFLKWG
ncbi:MAG: hypothetical protein K2Q28_04795 [Hyphomicrobium sp.]|jgi:hypothetical protein|nr:hypothetical protein [Hyphomicrobium sp.]